MAKTGCLIKSGGGTGQHVVELDDLLGLMFPLEYVDLDESQRRKNRTAASRAGGRPIRREAQLRSCQFLGGVGRCTTSYDTVLGSCVVVFKGRRPNFFQGGIWPGFIARTAVVVWSVARTFVWALRAALLGANGVACSRPRGQDAVTPRPCRGTDRIAPLDSS